VIARFRRSDATARILVTKRFDGRIEDDPLTLSAQGS
jgi:hypothetical protein